MATFKKITDLKKLKKDVKKHQAMKQKIAYEQARAQNQTEADREIFLKAVADVTPMPPLNRFVPKNKTVKPVPLQTIADEKEALDQSLSDEFTVESLLETDDQLSHVRNGVGTDVLKKLRRGYWVIQDEIDLHGLRRDEAREAIVAFLKQAALRGIRCVRVVHGKGLGSVNNEPVLKKLVIKWLAQRQDVIAFTQASPRDGGSGALVVLLASLAKQKRKN